MAPPTGAPAVKTALGAVTEAVMVAAQTAVMAVVVAAAIASVRRATAVVVASVRRAPVPATTETTVLGTQLVALMVMGVVGVGVRLVALMVMGVVGVGTQLVALMVMGVVPATRARVAVPKVKAVILAVSAQTTGGRAQARRPLHPDPGVPAHPTGKPPTLQPEPPGISRHGSLPYVYEHALPNRPVRPIERWTHWSDRPPVWLGQPPT